MTEFSSIPLRLYEDRLEWFKKTSTALNDAEHALPLTAADHSLLITGLRQKDRLRWRICGLLDAEVRTDPTDGSPFIALFFRRPDGTDGTTYRWLDPEAAFILQAHLFYGGEMRIDNVPGGNKQPYWYLRMYLPLLVQANRLIIDAERGRLAKENKSRTDPDARKDLRRRHLGRTITDGQATVIYREQKPSWIGRPEASEASVGSFKPDVLPLTANRFAEMMRDGYRLLDRHPLRCERKAKPLMPRDASS